MKDTIQPFRWSVVAGRSTLSIAVQTRFRTYFGLQNWKCPDDIEDSAQVSFISKFSIFLWIILAACRVHLRWPYEISAAREDR